MGHLDQQIHRNIFYQNQKQLNVAWTRDNWQKLLNFFEYCQKTNPTNFMKLGGEFRQFQITMLMLNRKYRLPLNDIARASNILVHHIVKPSFFFKEMVQSPESFATEVKPQVLNELVDQILDRTSQNEVSFEHLKASSSLYHQYFEPYNKNTFQVLQKIINDLIRDGEKPKGIKTLGQEQFQVINKILAQERLSRRLFSTSEDAIAILDPYLNQLVASI